MAKFIMSIGDEAYKVLGTEAKNRDVTVQQLLRAVIVPEWIKQNMNGQSQLDHAALRPSVYRMDPRVNNDMLVSPVNRLRH